MRQNLDHMLKADYEMVDLGWLSWSLGTRFVQDPSGRLVTADHKEYNIKLLSMFDMLNCRTEPTPGVSGQHLVASCPDDDCILSVHLSRRYRQLCWGIAVACCPNQTGPTRLI